MKKKYYCSLPFANYKHSAIRGIFNHNERQEGCYDNNVELDISRKDLNYHLKEPDGYYLETIRRRIKELGIVERKNSNLMCEFVLSASKEWINARSADEQKKYLQYGYEFIARRFGEKNILSAVVHMDESFPHLHVCLIPITEDGRLCSNDFLGGGRFALSGVIDEYYYHISKVYPELHRGIPFSKTKRKKIPLYLYRCVDDIYDQHREICSEIADINLLNVTTQKLLVLKDMQLFIENIAKVKCAVKSTDEHIGNMESQILEKDIRIENLKARLRECMAQIADEKVMKKELHKQLTEYKDIVSQLTIQERKTLLEKARSASRSAEKIENSEEKQEINSSERNSEEWL